MSPIWTVITQHKSSRSSWREPPASSPAIAKRLTRRWISRNYRIIHRRKAFIWLFLSQPQAAWRSNGMSRWIASSKCWPVGILRRTRIPKLLTTNTWATSCTIAARWTRSPLMPRSLGLPICGRPRVTSRICSVTRSTQKLAQCGRSLVGVTPSAQFIGLDMPNALIEILPFRSAAAIGLHGSEFMASFTLPQRPQQCVSVRRLLGEEDYGNNLQGVGCKAKGMPPEIDLALFHAAASCDQGRSANRLGSIRSHQPMQRIGADMQKVCHAGGSHAVRIDENAVFGQKFEPVERTMQGYRRFSRAARTHQDHTAAGDAHAGRVQGYEPLGPGGEGVHCEFQQFVANMVRETQHIGGHHHQRRALGRCDDHEVAGADPARKHTGTMRQHQRIRFGGVETASRARSKLQGDVQ